MLAHDVNKDAEKPTTYGVWDGSFLSQTSELPKLQDLSQGKIVAMMGCFASSSSRRS